MTTCRPRSLRRRCAAVGPAVLAALAAMALCTGAYAVSHPLDSLTMEEHWKVLEVLQSAGHLDAGATLPLVQLEPPSKSQILDWRAKGGELPRRARVAVGFGGDGYEAILDLSTEKVERWTKLEGVEIPWAPEDLGAVVDVVQEHPEAQAAMRRRGYDDWTFLSCITLPPGFYDLEEQRGRRVGHVTCTDPRARNTWARGIEGFAAVVDLDEGKVLRVIDEDIVPIPATRSDFDPSSIGPVREAPGRLRIEQPEGPGFALSGHEVTWQKWRFHLRIDQRVGPVLSLVEYLDDDAVRSVLYEAHLSEIFVPYMDPAEGWYHRNFIDAGEYPQGGLVKDLLPGRDCPEYAHFFDTVVPGVGGQPEVVNNALCLFERSGGGVAWRHFDSASPGLSESRPSTDLVVRSAASIGNYDYLFDWVFRQDGSIEVGVGATGIVEAKPVRSKGRSTETASTSGTAAVFDVSRRADADDAYGHFVADHVVAVNHSHYFSFRMDLDVDGTENSLLVDRFERRKLPKDHPRRSLWVVETDVAKTEDQARMTLDPTKPKMWRVASQHATNAVGYPTSFQIKAGSNARTLMSEDDMPRRRAGFIDHHLWVTPYEASERYAAGDYPTLSTPGQGLPSWSKERPIEGTDIVVWHTVGMHHVVRAEDWPVMPLMWHHFELRPFDFFDENPALDVPE